MITSTIEPCAARLFNIYYKHTQSSDLESLQYLVEEAYKLHERLRKNPKSKLGLFKLDEFLLLKTLRNYSVHQDEFVGKSYYLDRSFAQKMKLDLLRVCLVKKSTINLAINHEPNLEHGEENKVARIKAQLVDFGDHYNIEPVIFNFMVKVYEMLKSLRFAIHGAGFEDIEKSYKYEKHYNHPHYLALHPIDCDAKLITQNLVPVTSDYSKGKAELPSPESDPFHELKSLDIDYSNLSVYEYQGTEYNLKYHGQSKKICDNTDLLTIAKVLPLHCGMAFINTATTSGNVTCFNINAQRESFEEQGIHIDPMYYDLSFDELLVLHIYKDMIYPSILHKSSLIAAATARSNSSSAQKPTTSPQPTKVGRNDPCTCGSGKKFKKCCA
ncbi:YecA family protein [Vibrio splendidus]|uniref:YecA family protein n=1 Tax=Vibrio splendidus TaxID=29497 RepID=UPI00246956B2|nr:SEC-C metal-binding domain-containing protein [Vibrio splendidus]